MPVYTPVRWQGTPRPATLVVAGRVRCAVRSDGSTAAMRWGVLVLRRTIGFVRWTAWAEGGGGCGCHGACCTVATFAVLAGA